MKFSTVAKILLSEEMKEEVLSEIQIHFVGENIIFFYLRIVIKYHYNCGCIFYITEVSHHILGKTFLHVVQSRAFGGLSLFGNMGGYIGIFLGVAVLQFPDFLAFLYNRFRKFTEWKITK